MRRIRFSNRRIMAVQRTQEAYQRLYGEQPSNDSYNMLSAAELEALAERMKQYSRVDTDRVAVLGYN